MKIYTVFVEAKTPGNIGFLARCMKNFDFEDLILINPCKLDESSYYQAVHAQDIVENALIYDSIDEFIEDKEIGSVIGTSGSPGGKHNIKRMPITPEELGKTININSNIALLFGREGDGLTNDEINLCDILVSIPTSDEYPIMNITHAASIIFYEIFKNKKEYPVDSIDFTTIEDKKVLMTQMNTIISKLDYPEHKEVIVKNIAKHILGRSFITGREAKTLRGTLKRINQRINKDNEE
ncbi:MAG: RNA methyltransferase [Methanosphaera sp. rholeuAM130]|nr:TrmJ/YjtD family RNA methyltransferase [Methanosphaera sp.]RAP52173.1 MAG: RNA methyltransferase [Methanosphaera sp. rholeuAM130]